MSTHKQSEGILDNKLANNEPEGNDSGAPHQQEQPAEQARPASPEPKAEPEPEPETPEPETAKAKPKAFLPKNVSIHQNKIAGRNQFLREKRDLWVMQRAYHFSLRREAEARKKAEKEKKGEEKRSEKK